MKMFSENGTAVDSSNYAIIAAFPLTDRGARDAMDRAQRARDSRDDNPEVEVFERPGRHGSGGQRHTPSAWVVGIALNSEPTGRCQ